MAAKRRQSQARRNGGGGGGSMPGWAWLVIGVVLAAGLFLMAPKFLGDGSGFFRAGPDDAPKAVDAVDPADEPIVSEDAEPVSPTEEAAKPPEEGDYAFYTLLPGEETAMSDAELEASARAEEAKAPKPDATTATPDKAPEAIDAAPKPDTATASTPNEPAPASDARYILQAGAFEASGDAEALKAKIAFLGLGARVESAQINGKTVYRVRMGPYGTASELAEAKRKLSAGGLPALAIKVK